MPGEGGTGTGTGGGTGGTGGTGTGGTGDDRGDTGRRREGPQRGERGRGPRLSGRNRDSYRGPDELIESLIHKYGSRDRAIEELAKQTADLREDRRERDERIEELEALVPAKDAVVLTGDDVKKWDAVKKIDLPGEKIAERVQTAAALEGEKTKNDLVARRKDVAAKADLNGDVLSPLLDQFGLDVELKDIQVQGTDGKTTTKQVAHVRKAGDKDAVWEKLTDFATRDGSPLKPFEAALKSKPAGSSGSGTASSGNTGTGSTVTFPQQTGGNNDAGGGNPIVDEIRRRNRERAGIKPPGDQGKVA